MKFILSIFVFLVLTVSAHAQTPNPTPLPFLIAVEDTFYISGRGVVATGKIERGVIKTGDTIEIIGLKATKTAVVAGIEMRRTMVSEAKAGDIVGILLRGVEKSEVERGQVLAEPGTIKAYKRFEVNLALVATAAGGRATPIKDGHRGLFYFRTTGVSGTITLPAGVTSVAPGAPGILVTVTLDQTAALERGQFIGLRESNRATGGGWVMKVIE